MMHGEVVGPLILCTEAQKLWVMRSRWGRKWIETMSAMPKGEVDPLSPPDCEYRLLARQMLEVKPISPAIPYGVWQQEFIFLCRATDYFPTAEHFLRCLTHYHQKKGPRAK